jgi:hypothetical protein
VAALAGRGGKIDLDTELAFIRILSGGGVKLSGGIPAQDKRERIRVAILSQNVENKSFAFGPDHIMETYAQAFERCYGTRLELRGARRDPHNQPNLAETLRALDEDDDDDDETDLI